MAGRSRISNPHKVSAPRRRTPARRQGVRIGRLRLTHRAALGAILFAAIAVRFAGIKWGASAYLHPDERFMTMVVVGVHWPSSIGSYFDSATSPLNPYNNNFGSYLYGTFPLFLTKLLGLITNHVVYGDAHLPGRWLSALADTGAVALSYWIARRLFSPAAGLIAAALLAFTPLNVQAAHYFTTDAMAAFFAVAAFAAVVNAWFRGRWWWYALAGIAVGLAMASKPNLLLSAGFLLLPALESIRLRGWRALVPRMSQRDRWLPTLIGVVLSVIVAIVVFRCAQPYAFLGPHPWNLRLDPRWTADLDYWRNVQAGSIDLPPGVQWADRPAFTFLLNNLVRWGMGPALGLTALVSLGAIGWRLATSRRWPSWWMLAMFGWVLFHIVLYGTNLVKAQRYLLPAYPFLIILAAGQLDAWSPRLPHSWPIRRGITRRDLLAPGRLLIAIVILGTIFSGLALDSVFLRPQTRIVASEWIYDHVPAGSTIASEYWDDGLPITLPGRPTDSFIGIPFYPYDEDNALKLERFIGQLNRADYIVLSSDRLVGTIPRMPDRYPMMTAYYGALLSGDLGFDLVASFRSPPELFSIALDDRGAEESLTVYDHPQVRIFRKSDRYSTSSAWYLLNDVLGDGGVNRRPIDVPESSIMLSEVDRVSYAASGTWSNLFDDNRFMNRAPVLWWYLVLQLLSLPAIPIMWRLLPSLPDRGYAAAKTAGIMGIAWIAWLLASLRIVRFGPTGILIALAIAAAMAVLTLLPGARPILGDFRRRWRWIVATETLFLASFLAIAWLRFQNPDLWQPGRGGEKPMEFAFFNAILRSPWFPPYDPWFAGGTLHYYYLGYVPWAAISRLTGIAPEVAFNLAVPSVFSLVLLNAWSAAATLISHLTPAETDVPGSEPSYDPRSASWRQIIFALGAPVFVGILGNLDFVRRLGRGEWGFASAPSWMSRLGDVGRMGWGLWNALTGSAPLPHDAFWAPTRVIPNTINEFPYFTLLFGDLHAHLLAMPIVTVSIVVSAGVATSARARDSDRRLAAGMLDTLGGWRRVIPLALLAGLLSGMLIATNTWDYPPAVALVIAAAFICAFSGDGVAPPFWPAFRDVAIFSVLVLVSGRLFFQPYFAHYGSVPSQTLPAGETTRLSDYLAIHGVMLFAIGGYLVIELNRSLRLLVPRRSWGWPAAILAAGGLGFGFILATVTGNTALFLVAGLVTIALSAAGRWRSAPHLFVLAMIGLALGLALFAEVYRLANDVGRMNTVFKLYLHAWQLLGISAAIAAVQVVAGMGMASSRFRLPRHGQTAIHAAAHPAWPPRRAGVTGRAVWMVALAILVFAAATYPAMVTAPRLGDRFQSLDPTLDGLAYMNDANWSEGPDGGQPSTFPLANDRIAITWLRESIAGSPVILEAQLPAYRWGGRISSITGLPTVLGWTWHEIQQRPGYGVQVDRRVADVATMYGGAGPFASIQPLLDTYHVELIYIGDLERAIYGDAVGSKFDAAVEQGLLEMVFDANGVRIYRYHGEGTS